MALPSHTFIALGDLTNLDRTSGVFNKSNAGMNACSTSKSSIYVRFLPETKS